MDTRIKELVDSFSEIFEGRAPKLDLHDDDWVILDPEQMGDPKGESVFSEDEFLSDLDRFEDDFFLEESTTSGRVRTTDLPPIEGFDTGGLEEVLRRNRPDAIDKLRRRIGGRFGGVPPRKDVEEVVPPPDALAVYIPFHIHPERWGIYLLDAGVASMAEDVMKITRILGGHLDAIDARRVAKIYLYHHEAYHCAVESFVTRCELASRKPVYKRAVRKLYIEGYAPGVPHEESLASAYGITKVYDNIKLPKKQRAFAADALKIYLWLCPPEYRSGLHYINAEKFRIAQNQFAEIVLRRTQKKGITNSCWDIGTHMFNPLLQRNKSYSWICDRADFRNRSKLSVHYFRPRDVERCLEKLYGTRSEPGGRHPEVVRKIEVGNSAREKRSQLQTNEIPKGTLAKIL
jgi:hypothetical protein